MKPLLIFARQYSQRIMATALISLVVVACADHTEPQPPVVNCKLNNGMDRPYPCEFTIEKLIFLGNDGSTLDEVTPTSANVTLSIAKAKTNVGNSSGGNATYDVKAIVRRQNAPSFAVSSGYVLSYAFVDFPLQSDSRPVITSTQPFPMAVGSTQEVTFQLSFIYFISGGVVGTFAVPRSFFIENDVTTTKFAFNASVPVVDKARHLLK